MSRASGLWKRVISLVETAKVAETHTAVDGRGEAVRQGPHVDKEEGGDGVVRVGLASQLLVYVKAVSFDDVLCSHE